MVAGAARLQTRIEDPTTAAEPWFEVSLNDSSGCYDPETGIAGGSIRLDREAVKALLQSCVDFLVRT